MRVWKGGVRRKAQYLEEVHYHMESRQRGIDLTRWQLGGLCTQHGCVLFILEDRHVVQLLLVVKQRWRIRKKISRKCWVCL